jgi:hypothetical protein
MEQAQHKDTRPFNDEQSFRISTHQVVIPFQQGRHLHASLRRYHSTGRQREGIGLRRIRAILTMGRLLEEVAVAGGRV